MEFEMKDALENVLRALLALAGVYLTAYLRNKSKLTKEEHFNTSLTIDNKMLAGAVAGAVAEIEKSLVEPAKKSLMWGEPGYTPDIAKGLAIKAVRDILGSARVAAIAESNGVDPAGHEAWLSGLVEAELLRNGT